MNVVLMRVGADKGFGRVFGPLLDEQNRFEYLPGPDKHNRDSRKYGNYRYPWGFRNLIEYFPESRRVRMYEQSIHVDPEFETFTYGDPGGGPKKNLANLRPGDLLAFYCGLEGWGGYQAPRALYLIGYFDVERALLANERTSLDEVWDDFKRNFHVMHEDVFLRHRERGLVLVKGRKDKSKLLTKGVQISEIGRDKAGKPLFVLSRKMRGYFGDLGGKISIQRSPPRRVKDEFVDRSAEFIRGLDC